MVVGGSIGQAQGEGCVLAESLTLLLLGVWRVGHAVAGPIMLQATAV